MHRATATIAAAPLPLLPNQRKCAFLRAASSKSNAQGLQEEEQEID